MVLNFSHFDHILRSQHQLYHINRENWWRTVCTARYVHVYIRLLFFMRDKQFCYARLPQPL